MFSNLKFARNGMYLHDFACYDKPNKMFWWSSKLIVVKQIDVNDDRKVIMGKQFEKKKRVRLQINRIVIEHRFPFRWAILPVKTVEC